MTDNTMREAFEKWYMAQAIFHKSHLVPLPNGNYFGAHTETAWRSWQAAQSVPELDALRKDAERYRWLRDSPESPIINVGYATDKMVDAAIAAEGEKK